MTLNEFDLVMRLAWQLDQESHALKLRSRAMEKQCFKDAGLDCHNREPGFPCWTADGILGYYNTPRDALEAKIKHAQLPVADLVV